MEFITTLYHKTKDFFNKNYDSKGYIELESQGFEDYMTGLQKENEELKLKLKNYENDYLVTENLMLKEEIKRKDRFIDEITMDNINMESHMLYIESENDDLTEKNKILNDKIDSLEQQQEIDERIDDDIDYYGTKELDKNQYFDMLEKVTNDKNTYKDVINVMCDKYNIPHDSVLNILDNTQKKDINLNQLQREI
ncbi:MAG: hypothetical protein LIR50_05755 [Bacillota bacterium]|nr:hypothetical protein [Bacillota bacterium]